MNTHTDTDMQGNPEDAGLSQAERLQMRGELAYFISEHPARAPLSVRFVDRFATASAYFNGSRSRPVSLALALVLVVGIGTSYAAEAAIPGEALYAVKVKINEPIAEALAVSNTSKAHVHTTFITRRLEEAEALLAKGQLSQEAEEKIGTRLTVAARKFDASVHALSEKEGHTAIAEVQSNLEASLKGHEKVLAALTSRFPGRETSSASIASRVETRAALSADSRAYAEGSLEARNDETVRVAAVAKQNDAESAVGEARAMMITAMVSNDIATTAAASSSVEEAEAAIEVGTENLRQGEYGTAFKTFQAAIRAAQEAGIQIEASGRFETDLPARE